MSYPLYSTAPVSFLTQDAYAPYPEAMTHMETRASAIAQGHAPEQLWLLEHPSLYTAGTSAKPSDLILPERFDVFQSGRGGQYTYHGPGQRVAYVMLNLAERGKDIRCYVSQLESWIIDTLADFGIAAGRRQGRVGVWVNLRTQTGDAASDVAGEAKIAAIGVRVRKWVTFHGISINVNPDLSHFGGIVPCGISEHGVTSFQALGIQADMAALDAALIANFTRRFGALSRAL